MVASINEIASIICMAFALGMDAFSVGLGIGMQAIRLKRILLIGFVVGIFHVVMPFIGLMLGSILSSKIESIAILTAGLLLCAIGFQMMCQTFMKHEKPILAPVGFGLFVFSFSVSLDSFSIGLSLGLSGAATAFAITMFGLFSMVLTWTALLIGRRTHHLLGTYSELLGGIILFGFGLVVLL
ncbi:manganese efflux pump MntP family protein [Gracilibacillus caseinilyticus]|uniref:Putative manganese efflux pump MntP n=1 Tax=Gracilibacillus caseinilyticus TaxID=2932256 RepID=A0ABY4F0P6_9BACI|nr:manganese efflux pump [Gracilibacillus caseinilyticus]UOQ50242.1 manganese efflux pump MntP family protein [Gracilibacillus caseinilyticus]